MKHQENYHSEPTIPEQNRCNWKHCHVCGKCMAGYSVVPACFPEPVRWKDKE